jgi:D-3-phosphoglycerate dehydrogenase / 2-oxoglutarate reductase
MKLLITETIHPAGIKMLEKYLQVDCSFQITKEQLKEKIKDYDALIVRSGMKYDKELLEQGEKLKVIGLAMIGTDNIDLNYCKDKGIKVFNVPEGSYNSVAELAMTLILNVLRKIHPAVQSVKEKYLWDKTVYVGHELKGKALGIIAVGKIGSRLAKFAHAFDMQVLAYDPYVSPEQAKSMGVELLELDKLLALSDIISIHAPLTKQTYHMISEKQIDKMKNGVYLFNFGRGPIIDEESLYLALKKGKIAGVGVDVMEKEPPGKSKLFEFENFVVTPHIGAGTVEAQKYISEEIGRKVLKYFEFIDK